MSAQLTFPKKSKLKSNKLIDLIFNSGKNYYNFPIKCFFKVIDTPIDGAHIKTGFSVPKKLFKKAVSRNHLKRKMRESFRLNKSMLDSQYKDSSQCLIVMFVYTSKQIETYEIIDKSIQSSIQYLQTYQEKLLTS